MAVYFIFRIQARWQVPLWVGKWAPDHVNPCFHDHHSHRLSPWFWRQHGALVLLSHKCSFQASLRQPAFNQSLTMAPSLALSSSSFHLCPWLQIPYVGVAMWASFTTIFPDQCTWEIDVQQICWMDEWTNASYIYILAWGVCWGHKHHH